MELTIGSQTFDYPDNGQSPGYGEEATAWAEAVTDSLGSIAPAGSISQTSQTILGSQSGTSITGFSFSASTVLKFTAIYFVTRVSSGNEGGTINGYYDGSAWQITVTPEGSAAITFTITSGGQIQYTTTGADAGSIKFKTTALISA